MPVPADSTTMQAFIWTVGVLLLFVIAGRDGSSPATGAPPAEPAPITITLLRPLSDIRGIEVPEAVASGRRTVFQIKRPSIISLALPDGREFSVAAKTVLVNAKGGVVVDVDVLPLAKSVPYKDAVAALHQLLGALKIEPDDRMKEKMNREWPDDAQPFDPVKRPGFYPHNYRTGMQLSDDASLMVKLRSAEGGWFLVLTFHASGPKRRALSRHPATQPTSGAVTRPASRPATVER